MVFQLIYCSNNGLYYKISTHAYSVLWSYSPHIILHCRPLSFYSPPKKNSPPFKFMTSGLFVGVHGSRFGIWEKHVLFVWVWLISLNAVVSNSIYFPTNDISFFFMTEQYCIVCLHHIFIHSLVDGHLHWFHNLPVVNWYHNKHGRAAVCIACWLMFTPGSHTAGSYGRLFSGTYILIAIRLR
jgi:hypothetical protein